MIITLNCRIFMGILISTKIKNYEREEMDYTNRRL